MEQLLRRGLTTILSHDLDVYEIYNTPPYFASIAIQFGAPGGVRSLDPHFKRVMLYPAELRTQKEVATFKGRR